jgi:ATP-dependent DNA helicase DinG
MIVDSIKKILAAHPDEKGIIHANSYEIVKIVEQIKDRRLLIQRSGLDREDILRTHLTSPDPTVIVSPGMTEGIDLRDDLGRFQVICKVPYPYLGDPVVAAKSKADSGWYAWRTITTLVQAAGRCVRSAEDSAATYILDECLIDVMHRWPKMFPDYWNSISMLSSLRRSLRES